jgi:hypothetical protein
MNTPSLSKTFARKLAVSALLMGAAFVLGACSTTSTARLSTDGAAGANSPAKMVSYNDLHGQMERIANEPEMRYLDPTTGALVTTGPSSGSAGGTVAVNP